MVKFPRLLTCFLVISLLFGTGGTARGAIQPAGDLAGLPSKETASSTEWQANLEIPETFEMVGENDLFQLYANPDTLAFKVVDKRSGYVWHSNLDEKGEDDRLNKTWTAFAQSGISIDYLDAKAISERLSITNSENNIDYRKTNNGFEATVAFVDASITLDVHVSLDASGVRVEVPFESIIEGDPEFKLGLIYVYPFFGATRGASVPGYMFIPDGSGSLIRFSDTTKAKNMYYGRYYGDDLGMITAIPWDPTQNRPLRISIPVTGMVHGEGQNAYIAIVEAGAPYGEINAHPSGVITNFNFIHNLFIYNESYFQPTNRSGAGVTTLQPETNAFDIQILYRFLTGEESDYVGMARSYQQYLVEKGELNKVVKENEDIGIRLEFLGGEKEKVLFWWRAIPMTTVAQMKDILDKLEVENPEVIYYGWQPLGATTMPPRSLKLASQLGSVDELQALSDEIEAGGGYLYLYVDPQAAFYEEKGYSSRYDLAMSIQNINLIGYNRERVNYYMNYEAISKRYPRLFDGIADRLDAGVALDGIGSMVYTDFKRSNFLSREDSIHKYQEFLAEQQVTTSFYLPNDYMYRFTRAYYDIPLTDNGYIYTSEAVPFLQIVLSGYIPYYGPVLNFSPSIHDDLLRHADYGIYPSFFLTQQPTSEILTTRSSWIYTSSYDQWGQEVNQAYQWLNNLLAPVTGASIIARETLSNGVVAVTYSNGKSLIVNYSDVPYDAGSLVVNAKDAVITEVAP